MSTRPRRLLLPLALAAVLLLAGSSASQAVNISLQPPYNVVNAVGVAPAGPQQFTAGGIQFACTPTVTFRVNVPAVAGAVIGNLIPMLHITAVNFAACPAGVVMASLNNAANPIIVGQLTATTPGGPGTVLFVALNVRVRVTLGAAMQCLFTGSMGIRILANGTVLLLGGNLVSTPIPAQGDTCLAGIVAVLGPTTYTPAPPLFANVI
ncbi:MAG TPA: hypothetical protein VLK58_14925 [Conexibacter sp.]|nr:hypothetical protein [Conexibacter sp.]